MKTNKLKIAAAKVVLKIALPEDLIEAGVDALEEGLDTRSLRILAGLTVSEADEARPLFDLTLDELNILKPNQHDAVMLLAREYAKQILDGKISAYLGARRIWDIAVIPDEHVPELDTFEYGASEWEDRPEDAKIFEKGIIAAAKDLLAG